MKKHYYHDDLRVDRAIRTITTRISQGAAAMRRHPGAAGVVSAAYWLLVLVLFMGHNPDVVHAVRGRIVRLRRRISGRHLSLVGRPRHAGQISRALQRA